MIHVDVRTITVGHVHAERGDPRKVAAMHEWLTSNPEADLPALDVRAKPNGTYRIHDGRHRFLAYAWRERASSQRHVGELCLGGEVGWSLKPGAWMIRGWRGVPTFGASS